MVTTNQRPEWLWVSKTPEGTLAVEGSSVAAEADNETKWVIADLDGTGVRVWGAIVAKGKPTTTQDIRYRTKEPIGRLEEGGLWTKMLELERTAPTEHRKFGATSAKRPKLRSPSLAVLVLGIMLTLAFLAKHWLASAIAGHPSQSGGDDGSEIISLANVLIFICCGLGWAWAVPLWPEFREVAAIIVGIVALAIFVYGDIVVYRTFVASYARTASMDADTAQRLIDEELNHEVGLGGGLGLYVLRARKHFEDLLGETMSMVAHILLDFVYLVLAAIATALAAWKGLGALEHYVD